MVRAHNFLVNLPLQNGLGRGAEYLGFDLCFLPGTLRQAVILLGEILLYQGKTATSCALVGIDSGNLSFFANLPLQTAHSPEVAFDNLD